MKWIGFILDIQDEAALGPQRMKTLHENIHETYECFSTSSKNNQVHQSYCFYLAAVNLFTNIILILKYESCS